MEWTDEGIILGARPYGENHAVAEVFTPSAGRVVALVHGGQGRLKQPLVQSGNGVVVTWKGRSEESLGHFSIELTMPRAAALMHDSLALVGLSSMTTLLSMCMPERQSVPRLYDATKIILDLLEEKTIWPIAMTKWELGLLSSLGFGLRLDVCAATGAKLEDGADLVFVSPKSGGAVSHTAGMPYRDKLLPLAPFLTGRGEPTKQDIMAAFSLTAFFIEDRILAPANKELPDVRKRLVERLGRL